MFEGTMFKTTIEYEPICKLTEVVNTTPTYHGDTEESSVKLALADYHNFGNPEDIIAIKTIKV